MAEAEEAHLSLTPSRKGEWKEKKYLSFGGRTESKGRSEEALSYSASNFRCFDSQMCFGDGCVISHPPYVRIFGIRRDR